MSPVFWGDMMRWWAFGGGVLGIWPLGKTLFRHTRNYLTGPGYVRVPASRLLIEKAGLLFFLLFVIVAGGLIPLTTRVDGFGPNDVAFLTAMACAWTSAGMGAWAVAAAFSANRYLTTAAAGTWFVAVAFATQATAG